MRNVLLLILAISWSGFGQDQAPAAPAAEPKPAAAPVPPTPPNTVMVTPEMLRDLQSLMRVIVLPVSGECVIPMRKVPVAPDVNYRGKVATPGTNTAPMPTTVGLPICGAIQPPLPKPAQSK